MKTTTLLMTAVLSMGLLWAADEGAEKKEEGNAPKIVAPNGGRVIHDVDPHVEFLITKDRKVQMTFLDDEGKPVESKVTVGATGGKRTAPVRFTFAKTKSGFLSEQKLPEGMNVPMVLMFRDAEGKKGKTIKFNVDLNQCPTCDFLEYACVCDHDHNHKE